MSRTERFRVTGVSKARIDGEPDRYRWTVFLRPAAGTGHPTTLYVEAAQQPYTPDAVVELCPDWICTTPE